MSLTSFGSFLSAGSSVNPSIAWARGKHGEGRFRITFPLDSAWYKEQACTRFRSLEHRKERRGFQHEFIVLKLENGSICRIERLGDPDTSFDAISKQGIVAHDIAQSFPPGKLSGAHLDTSDVVAEITFPYSLDLKTVLLICRAMQEGEKTCNYTLQVFNCYFFALVIQAALTRLVADWGHALRDEIWHSALGRGLSVLSNFYKAVSSTWDQQPFILRIHSALQLDTQWPAEDLVRNLKWELRQLTEVSQVSNTVLWHTDTGLALDHVLGRRVRDVAVGILKDLLKIRSGSLLIELISRAISSHEQELQSSRLSHIQQVIKGKVHLIWEFEPLLSGAHQVDDWTLGFLPSKSQSHLDPRQSGPDSPQLLPDPSQPHPGSSQSRLDPPQPTPLRFSRASQLSVWLTYVKILALWAFQVVLGLIWVDLLGSAQPALCLFVEDELEPSLTILASMSQKLRSLLDEPQLLVQWKEWPWDHIYQPIRRHTLELLAEEQGVLQVSFPNGSNQAVTVFKFQEHLLERIRAHAKRVESFQLGSAAQIQDEMKDRISQVWALIRPDDTTRGPPVPLRQSKNRWIAGSTQRTPQQIETRALVERRVKSLLNKLTMDKFDSISDQIIEWANKSEQEKDGSTLIQVVELILEKAKDEARFSEMYARLCRKMRERVSPNVQDETSRNAEGQPITGGLLFRKYLLNRCQEDFERGWSAEEAAAALAASKAGDDKAAEAASQANGEAVLYSEEYYAAAKAKHQGLGLMRFIGELFKLQILTEHIMHECIKKLLSNVVNPEEEEIESLCELLTTAGQNLDNARARNHMDIYFERMQEMARGSNINSRVRFMLQDVIELRHRHWQARSAVVQSSTIAAGHEQAKRDVETDVVRGEGGVTSEPAAADLAPMSEVDAQKKVKEDIKEYLGVENVEEAILAFETLPTEHRHIFVDKMVGAALDGGNKVVVLAERLFAAIHKQQACSAGVFERGLLPTVEMADDMSIDVPKAYEWLARLIRAAGIDRTKAEELARKISVLGEPVVQPRDLLMQEFDKALG